MGKMPAEAYLDKLLNSVNDEKVRREKFKETAKILNDAMSFWDLKTDDMNFQDVSRMQPAAQPPTRSQQEDILDAMLSNAQNTEFGMNKRRQDANLMYSRRVSRSEEEFLRQFEEELASGDDDFADLLASWDTGDSLNSVIMPEDRLEAEDIHAAHENYVEKEGDGFALDDVDLASIISKAADVMAGIPEETIPEQPVLREEIPEDDFIVDDIPKDVFEDLFGGDTDLNLAENVPIENVPVENVPAQNDPEAIDLGNLGEDDLMNLLAGTDDLADIGDLLSKSEATEIPLEELDAFTVFAENEMSAQEISADPVMEDEDMDKKGKKNKKGGLFGKLKAIFANLMKDDEDDEVEIKPVKNPSAEVLSSENADILAELDALEEKPSKKDKKKKEKKEKKEKKPKKEKAPKKPKAPKPKKEKKPKEVDNTPPLPKGPVFMIWIMAASLVALVLLGVNLINYNTPIANAKNLQNQGHYAEAFAEINGLKIKEKDMEMYNRLAVLSTVDSELKSYDAFTKAEVEDWAFDSLICAAGRCYINEENADVYGCLGQLETLKRTVSNELEQKYNMTYEEAIEMYTIRDRDDYTIALYMKLTELGIDWE